MPIYEFRCKQCDSTFEKLFTSSRQEPPPACPECESSDITQMFSVFGVGTLDTVDASTTDMPMCGDLWTSHTQTVRLSCPRGCGVRLLKYLKNSEAYSTFHFRLLSS